MECRFSVEYVSLPPEMEDQWWAAMRWVWRLINDERSLDGGTALGGTDEQDGDAHDEQMVALVEEVV